MLLELVALGYAASSRLRQGLTTLSVEQLSALRTTAIDALAAARGAGVRHRPLFRRFPRGIPRDTAALWFRRVSSHYIQTPDQPCLSCDREGSTHVLRPCEHVVCDGCFDGSNYSACPICNRHVDTDSPFFRPADLRDVPKESVRFERLDLGGDLDASARALFDDFCARKQALSPTDKADFGALIDDYAEQVLAWLPERIPLRENIALIFGRLFTRLPAAEVLPVARVHLTTATDVLRFLATFSGADAGLQGATVYEHRVARYEDLAWFQHWETHHPEHAARYRGQTTRVAVPRVVKRFPMAKLPRSLRRALLAILDGLDRDTLIEDMLRHRSYWVWVGQFLHPGEYAARFPNVAGAFAVVRKKDPDGVRAPKFRGFNARVELAAARGDAGEMMDVLATRPGELARRLDHLIRVAGDDDAARDAALATFIRHIRAYGTPVLLTLLGVLPTRGRPAQRRVFWPKGDVARGASTKDGRPALPKRVIAGASTAIRAELLRRFAELPRFETALVDDALADIVVPFNARTASPSAVDLPRGSRVKLPAGKQLRLFLHWCEREGGTTTDIDLSVAFYDARWTYVGVCSYYQLTCTSGDHRIAVSSGDLTSAPYPDGASEFVDIDRDAARAAGVRYAVMVVNAYAGDPFDRLERGFAGLMLRDDVMGHHFDPRTVALKFGLQGSNGVFTPLCVDLDGDVLHWLDIYSKGQLAMNNVATSNRAVTRVCPETIDYFASGVRLDMFRLARLHAAARSRRVVVRVEHGAVVFERDGDESTEDFWRRLADGRGGELLDALPELGDAPILALLHRGDQPLPADSEVYALFRDRSTPTLAAADLI